MLCVPAARLDVVKAATPPLSDGVPRTVVPSVNVTMPVGFVPDCGVTVAVKITGCPVLEGLRLEITAVLVPDLLTTCVNGDDVLIRKFVSPPYTAVIVCIPPVSVGVLMLA